MYQRAYLCFLFGLVVLLVVFFNSGEKLPLQEAWVVAGWGLIAASVVLLVKAIRHAAANPAREELFFKKVDRLKASGLRFPVTAENCEVRSRSFQHEVVQDDFPSEAAAFSALLDEERAYRSYTVQQTYVVMIEQVRGVPHKFISQALAFDESVVRMRLDEQGATLYVNPADPGDYYFELPL